jgi:hypothetical protein
MLSGSACDLWYSISGAHPNHSALFACSAFDDSEKVFWALRDEEWRPTAAFIITLNGGFL